MAAQLHAVCANIHSPCCSYSGPARCRSTTVTSGGAALRNSVKSLQLSRSSSSFLSCIRTHRQSGLFPPRRIAGKLSLSFLYWRVDRIFLRRLDIQAHVRFLAR
ncbi:hypothetical protein KC19_2G045100 [Ceratodon purpureus]|uniref:Uncharacterized protein n=1 Tax=Ceratodon purpureus TaxID=3225 RepID=A0A8T0IRT8_CERPU|nr:hypothetical protein KC19_2G045100 [Ceratodon purpureus]